MYNKNNIALAKVASTSTIREELACVAFYGDKTVATDSFRLVEMSASGKAKKTPVLYPAKALKAMKPKKTDEYDDKSIPVKPAEAKGDRYPEYEQIFKRTEGKKYAEVKLNAEYLADLCTLLKDLDPFSAITLRVPIESRYEPVILEADSVRKVKKEGEQVQRARALLMPMNH